MRLNDLVRPQIDVELIRDAYFENLGSLSSQSPNVLAPVYDRRFIAKELIGNPNVVAVVAKNEMVPEIPSHLGLMVARQPQTALFEIHTFLARNTNFYGDTFPTEIDPTAFVHQTAHVAAQNVRIGPYARVGPGAIINERSVIGMECMISEGCIVGADGFDPCPVGDTIINVPHSGGVVLENSVTLLAGAVVCRAKYRGATVVGANSVIGIRAVVSHNSTVGRNCRICAGVSISGSCRIGDYVYIGPQATISNRVSLADRSRVSIGAVVITDVEEGKTVSGNFAIPHKEMLRQMAASRKKS